MYIIISLNIRYIIIIQSSYVITKLLLIIQDLFQSFNVYLQVWSLNLPTQLCIFSGLVQVLLLQTSVCSACRPSMHSVHSNPNRVTLQAMSYDWAIFLCYIEMIVAFLIPQRVTALFCRVANGGWMQMSCGRHWLVVWRSQMPHAPPTTPNSSLISLFIRYWIFKNCQHL